jgi:hypothetical protein
MSRFWGVLSALIAALTLAACGGSVRATSAPTTIPQTRNLSKLRTFHFVESGPFPGDKRIGVVDLAKHRMYERQLSSVGDEIDEIDDGSRHFLRSSATAPRNRGWCLAGTGAPPSSWGLIEAPFNARSTFLTGDGWQRVGEESSSGVSTTHYHFDAGVIPGATPPTHGSLDVWIDGNDRVARFSSALDGSPDVVDYSELGKPVTISIPTNGPSCPPIPGA